MPNLKNWIYFSGSFLVFQSAVCWHSIKQLAVRKQGDVYFSDNELVLSMYAVYRMINTSVFGVTSVQNTSVFWVAFSSLTHR